MNNKFGNVPFASASAMRLGAIGAMMKTICLAVAALLSASTLVGCSKPPPATPPAAVIPIESEGAAAATEAEAKKACDLVTAKEMSVILGSAVTAEPNDGSSGKTECLYKAVAGVSPYVEFSVEWGEGEAALKAAGAMNQHEPGIADPYQGIGDQAVAVGPSLMIRSGDDLVSIVFSGVADAPTAARKIFTTAKARL